jgi:predicted tellurium resistance membrane protein TerC
MVIAAIGIANVIFAVDSIPAIFGLTRDAYIVLTANVFALLGLRQLYTLVAGLLERLYISTSAWLSSSCSSA